MPVKFGSMACHLLSFQTQFWVGHFVRINLFIHSQKSSAYALLTAAFAGPTQVTSGNKAGRNAIQKSSISH